MKRSELKKLIKPLIKECLNEVLLESGLLSAVISEVFEGLSNSPRPKLHESLQPEEPFSTPSPAPLTAKLKETRKRMLDAVGSEAYRGTDLFEGTTPLNSAGSPGTSPGSISPLAGTDPRDAGVDIASLMPGMDKLWKKLM